MKTLRPLSALRGSLAATLMAGATMLTPLAAQAEEEGHQHGLLQLRAAWLDEATEQMAAVACLEEGWTYNSEELCWAPQAQA